MAFVEQKPTAPASAAIRAQLAKLLSSATLANAARLSCLLRFVVEETLEGRGSELKEARIGLDVFGRKPQSYDPAIDPIVRVQMGRLRTKLVNYYSYQGAGDQILIEIPVGSYVPSFATRVVDATRPMARIPLQLAEDDLRLAVLPFVNMTVDPENQSFCDGLTEELINRLARVSRLRVVARTSSFQFKDAARDIREVGRLLDVSKVLEGSVRKVGDCVRVTVQLINVADGCLLWSERYEGELKDIFTIHENISCAIQQALQIELLRSADSRRPHTQGLESYNHYLQGRFLWKKRTEQGLRAALDHFNRAVQFDPKYARALSGIADCHVLLALSAAESPQLSMPKAAEAAREALRLDDRLAEAHASLAAVKNCYEWDLAGAEEGYRRSLTFDPSYATALHWRALFIHAAQGQFDAASDDLQQAIELDPLSPPIIADLALVNALRGDFDAAVMYCRRALELDPYFHRPFWFLGLTRAWTEEYAGAEEALKTGLDLCRGSAFRSRLLGALGFVYGSSGKLRSADEVIRELERMRGSSYIPNFELAQIQYGAGRTKAALASLERAVDGRESFGILLGVWRSFRPLRKDTCFQRLVTRTGLAL